MWLANTLYIWLNLYLDKILGGGLSYLHCDFTNAAMATNSEHNKNSARGAYCAANSWGAFLDKAYTVIIIITHILLHSCYIHQMYVLRCFQGHIRLCSLVFIIELPPDLF